MIKTYITWVNTSKTLNVNFNVRYGSGIKEVSDHQGLQSNCAGESAHVQDDADKEWITVIIYM